MDEETMLIGAPNLRESPNKAPTNQPYQVGKGDDGLNVRTGISGLMRMWKSEDPKPVDLQPPLRTPFFSMALWMEWSHFHYPTLTIK